MEAISTSEILVNFYQITWRNIPEDSHLQITKFFTSGTNISLLTIIQHLGKCLKIIAYPEALGLA
jgi:hypothetical protein